MIKEEERTKRDIPSGLKKLLDMDVRLTKEIMEQVNQRYPTAGYRHHLKTLEISCHGIPWLMFAVAGIYVSSKLELFVNLLIGLLLDIVIVAVLKAFTRRRRPAVNVDDQHATLKMVDKFSFPSGHATRAVMVAALLTLLWPLPLYLVTWPLMLAWAGAVSVSRVLLGRHHLADVVAGVMIGLAEARLLGWLWLEEEQCKGLVGTFLGGGEDPWSSG